MSRPKTNIYELDGTRFKNAIKAKGYSYRDFAELITGKRGKAASDWICQICLPSGNRNKLPVNARRLQLISNELNVRKEYLMGWDDFQTEKDLDLDTQKQIQKEYRDAKKECDSFLLPIMEKAGFTLSQIALMDDCPLVILKDRSHDHYILAEDLRKMEKITIDLIRSMICNMDQNQPR